MSRFRHVELQYASRLLNHGPTILITSYDAPVRPAQRYGRRLVNAGGIRPAAGGYRGG